MSQKGDHDVVMDLPNMGNEIDSCRNNTCVNSSIDNDDDEKETTDTEQEEKQSVDDALVNSSIPSMDRSVQGPSCTQQDEEDPKSNTHTRILLYILLIMPHFNISTCYPK